MVVAEVPLWVAHQSSSSSNASDLQQSLQLMQGASAPSVGAISSTIMNGGGGGIHSHPSTTTTSSSPSSRDAAAAASAVSLLQGRATRKSPLYSVDVHPHGHVFATGGGDGAVKLWNVHALFQSSTSGTSKKPAKKRSHYDQDTGAYVSSTCSSSSSGGNSSNSEEEAEKAGEEDESSSSVTSELIHQLPQDIHDLSSLVRRKTNGQQLPQSPPPKPVAATTTTTPTPSRSQPTPTNGNNNTATPPSTISKKCHSSSHHHHPRLLATLTAHTGSCVLCVRFSHSGEYLASAGDDAVVCIYRRSIVNNNSTNNAEDNNETTEQQQQQWTRVHLCRGHGLDVVDLAWAPDDSHLVSASLDSQAPIIVWKLHNHSNNNNSMLLSPYKILGRNVHTSTVKGVCFDPAGSYLASSGDDPAVCIWRAHDDWGLEQRVDSIFNSNSGNKSSGAESTMFRRLSWSTDGSFIIATNSVVKKKHVASTISREGWSASSSSNSSPQHQQQQQHGAANLVGHKQPIVVSRHAPVLLKNKTKEEEEDDDIEDNNNGGGDPQYATLLALGDKRGFVTVWTTKKSRPLFKLQCSESRCFVTDLAWGKLDDANDGTNAGIMLLVTLLDGQVVALRFGADEVGPILSKQEQARVFELKYGIDVEDAATGGLGRLFVGENSGRPKFIENTLQMSLEQEEEEEEDMMMIEDDDDDKTSDEEPVAPQSTLEAQQQTTNAQGKKRVRPLLVGGGASASPKRVKSTAASQTKRGGDGGSSSKDKSKQDPLQRAISAAEKAERNTTTTTNQQSEATSKQAQTTPLARQAAPAAAAAALRVAAPLALPSASAIPHSTDRVHVVELEVDVDEQAIVGGGGVGTEVETKLAYTAECTNSIKVPRGSSSGGGLVVPMMDLCLSRNGQVLWRDQLPGTSCCSLAASKSFLAVGTTDGTVQLYASSPSMGWKSGCSFRSHPPLVMGHPVITLRFDEKQEKNDASKKSVELLIVLADGTFALYSLLPHLRLLYKGSIMPAMTHMALSASSSSPSADKVVTRLPGLSRIQLTESGRLLLLLSLDSTGTSQNSSTEAAARSGGSGSTTAVPEISVGGSLQAFVYDRPSELWMRMSDSRFVLSDFYSSLPSKSKGELGRLDDTVRIGSMQSSLKVNFLNRGRADRYSESMYKQDEDHSKNLVATRSHCEDRMACALAIGSAMEFKHWLGMYVRTLSMAGQSAMLRMLVDMLTGTDSTRRPGILGDTSALCWWLSSAPEILGLLRKDLVRSVIIPELSKNRSLQRLTNELSLALTNS